VYQSQTPVIERAIETAALMLGSDRSRGYCLEMICADFLAGANLDQPDPEMLLYSMTRFFKFLRRAAAGVPYRPERESIVTSISSQLRRLRLDPASYESLRRQVLHRDGWRCQSCGTMSNLEVHHREFRSHLGEDSEENLITLCTTCHATVHHR
jgi:hypothetical protein